MNSKLDGQFAIRGRFLSLGVVLALASAGSGLRADNAPAPSGSAPTFTWQQPGSAPAPAHAATPVAASHPAIPTQAAAGADAWPHVFVTDGVTTHIYQPQVDAWDGFNLKARAAASVQPAGELNDTFGLLTLTAHTIVDKTTRTVTVEDVQIQNASFPTATNQAAAWLPGLRQSVSQSFKSLSLDTLEASGLILAENKAPETRAVNNTPPQLIFSKTPALLVYVDGAPAYAAVNGTSLQRVLNTGVLLLHDQAGHFYLHIYDGFVQAPSLQGPWSVVSNPTVDMLIAEKQGKDSSTTDMLAGAENPETKQLPSLKQTTPPVIYTATTPSELIVTEGEPNFVPVPETQLLYVANTTASIFKEVGDQKTYVCVSGRWYRATTLQGPWEYVPGHSLPADFAKIPDTSPKENVKASIPGTPQAREALIANIVPQTTKVNPQTTQMADPGIDGAPQVRPIEGTPLGYVANSATPIIKVNETAWYAVQNGVWFTANSANGPWAVATAVPSVIYSIPTSSPMHYVTYVKVYASTPEYVYEGYTPGYMGTVVNPDGVVVYGTGYYYQPWIGTTWYGYPATWGYGCNVGWAPACGWGFGFGFGWNWGWGSLAIGWGWGWGGCGWGWAGCHPCWGPYWGHGYQNCAVGWSGHCAGWTSTCGNVYHASGTWHGAAVQANAAHAASASLAGQNFAHAYNSRTGTIAAGERAPVRAVPSATQLATGKGTTPAAARATASGFAGSAARPVAASASGAQNVQHAAPAMAHGNQIVHGNSAPAAGRAYSPSGANSRQQWAPTQNASRPSSFQQAPGSNVGRSSVPYHSSQQMSSRSSGYYAQNSFQGGRSYSGYNNGRSYAAGGNSYGARSYGGAYSGGHSGGSFFGGSSRSGGGGFFGGGGHSGGGGHGMGR